MSALAYTEAGLQIQGRMASLQERLFERINAVLDVGEQPDSPDSARGRTGRWRGVWQAAKAAFSQREPSTAGSDAAALQMGLAELHASIQDSLNAEVGPGQLQTAACPPGWISVPRCVLAARCAWHRRQVRCSPGWLCCVCKRLSAGDCPRWCTHAYPQLPSSRLTCSRTAAACCSSTTITRATHASPPATS